MRKFYSLTLLLQLVLSCALGLSTELAAQGKPTDMNIIGHVADAKTGEHLAGITIAIKGTTSAQRQMLQGTTSSRISSKRRSPSSCVA